jgi:hypothetical protein
MSSSEDKTANETIWGRPKNYPIEPRYQYDVNYIAESIRNGRCILFLGSAIHREAPNGSEYDYRLETRPLVGNDLSNLLAGECDYPDTDRNNLQRVSWYYEWYWSRSRLVSTVKDAVHKNREPSPILRGLARLGFPLVVTTNYDQLYEQALVQVATEKTTDNGNRESGSSGPRKTFEKCVYSPHSTAVTKDCIAQPSRDCPYLLKIHGDVDQSESIVITDEDYIQFVLRMSDRAQYKPVGRSMLTHLATWPTLFIGYRLKDYNLRLLFKSLRWKLDVANIPDAYAVDHQPDVLIRDVWQNRLRYVRFIEKNLWDFVPDLYRAVTGQEMPQ